MSKKAKSANRLHRKPVKRATKKPASIIDLYEQFGKIVVQIYSHPDTHHQVRIIFDQLVRGYIEGVDRLTIRAK